MLELTSYVKVILSLGELIWGGGGNYNFPKRQQFAPFFFFCSSYISVGSQVVHKQFFDESMKCYTLMITVIMVIFRYKYR